MLEITSTTQNARVPVTIINVKGAIDSSNYQEFQTETEKVINAGAHHLLFNMQDVSYMSSAGLRVIHALFNKLREIHKDVNDEELRKKMSSGAYKSPYIKVANMSEALKELFEISGFETYIEAYDDISSAINSF
jgi:anti-anti-sigma factor